MAKKAPPPPMKALFKRPAPPAAVAASEVPKQIVKDPTPDDPTPPWDTGGYNVSPLMGYVDNYVSLDKKWMGTRACLVRADKMTQSSQTAHKHLPRTQDLPPTSISEIESLFSAKRKTMVIHRVENVRIPLRPDVGIDDPQIPDEFVYAYRSTSGSTVVLVNVRLDPPDRLILSGQDDEAKMASMAKDYFCSPVFLKDPKLRKTFNEHLLAGRYTEAAKAYNDWITDPSL